MLGPQVRVGGQVINVPTTMYGLTDRLAIADVGSDDLDLVQRQMIGPSTGPFEDADPFSMVNQAVDQVAADEAGPAGDGDHTSFRILKCEMRGAIFPTGGYE